MSDAKTPSETALPTSLDGHVIPEARLAAIRPLVVQLSKSMLKVSKDLPFSADAADFVRALETEAR